MCWLSDYLRAFNNYNVVNRVVVSGVQLDPSLDFVYELAVVILATGLLLWFILVFVPQHIDEIREPKDD
ncbi:MAG: hypothetical protein K2X81_03400 [Candidatus Obscuribacterales bacterium]|nr:hypothetical protein [Candidatus Obscuribacterales bacterium]